jgi:hypothetical protein
MDEPIRVRLPSDAPPPPLSTIAAEAFAGYLDELERICEAATPGPWTLDEHRDRLRAVNGDPIAETWNGTRRLDDARFIEAARHALPKLIANVRELEHRAVKAEARLGAEYCGYSQCTHPNCRAVLAGTEVQR